MISVELKPNHVCCNPKCTKGADGGRKKYYACDYCDRTRTWISLCCSKECFVELTNRGETAIPQRTDKTQAEVEELMSTPEDIVKERSIAELTAAGYDISEDSLSDAIEAVNVDLDAEEE